MIKRVVFAALRGAVQEAVTIYVKSRCDLSPVQQFLVATTVNIVLLVALRFIEGKRDV